MKERDKEALRHAVAKQLRADNDEDELREMLEDIRARGPGAGFRGFTYNGELIAFYTKNAELLHELLADCYEVEEIMPTVRVDFDTHKTVEEALAEGHTAFVSWMAWLGLQAVADGTGDDDDEEEDDDDDEDLFDGRDEFDPTKDYDDDED